MASTTELCSKTVDNKTGNFTNYKYFTNTKLHPCQKRALVFSITVIMTSLAISLVQMPAMVHSYSIRTVPPLNKIPTETDSKLLLPLVGEKQPSEQISFTPDERSLSNSVDVLTSLDVVKHIQYTQQNQRERKHLLRKRQLGDLIITKYSQETDPVLEWQNPCNGQFHQVTTLRSHKNKEYDYLKKLENDVRIHYDFLSITKNTIDISDIKVWSKHKEVFKFLPTLRDKESVALARWHRSMQVYVASFDYLLRSQSKFDKIKLNYDGITLIELYELLISARYILCELEITLNGTAGSNNMRKHKILSSKYMNKVMNFVTQNQYANGDVYPASIADLKFTKSSYYNFLLTMQKILASKNAKKYGSIESSKQSSTNNLLGDNYISTSNLIALFKNSSGDY